jgi:long-subunit acyl-CoA synthetase (AMP-forming)
MANGKLILDYIYEHEEALRDRVYLTQPLGGGQVADYTWGQAMDQARRMAAHLQGRGFAPGARIAILSKNSAHFFMAEMAIWMAGYTTVAIFPTETAATVKFVLEHSESSLLFVGKLDTWPAQAPGVPQGLPCIALPLSPPTAFETWDAITARTEPLAGKPQRGAADLAMLIYTSGSTGQPKGAMHSFEGITRAAEGIGRRLVEQIGADTELRVLSYLPLAHCYERAWIESASMVNGRTHVFFAESLDTFVQDLQRARPTCFISVPRLWLKFQQGVFTKMPAAKLDRLLRIPILGRIVGRKVLKGLGLDQVKLAGSGSAPIPPALIDWYRRLGMNLVEGYAMTEDFAYSHGSTPGKSAPGHVGVPYPEVQARLSPEGEILVKSPGKMVGYYKRPDLDAEGFTEDGFFHTGDLGEYNAQGLLKLTGRIKDQFKTSKGKYVAPAPIENRLNAHPMVELSMVSGVGQPDAYAVLMLAETLRPKLGDAAVRAEVERELTQLLADVNRDLVDYEKLRMLVVANEPWSVDNGCLTPTMKIRRARVEEMVGPGVDGWYSRRDPVQWA